MKTLIDKVQAVEQTAHDAIASAERDGKQAVAGLLADEERVREDIRATSQQKAEQIVSERVAHAKAELNKLHQEEAHSVEQIHEAAERNRSDAVTYALGLFTSEYQSGA